MPYLDSSLHTDIVALLRKVDPASASGRQSWLLNAGVPDESLQRIGHREDSPYEFVPRIVRALSHSELLDVLRTVGADLGVETESSAQDLGERVRLHQQVRREAGNPLLNAYREACIGRWDNARYHVDHDFVRLIILYKDDKRGYIEQDGSREYQDLRILLPDVEAPAVVLLGAPGGGKSTLLRRLQIDDAQDRLSGIDPAGQDVTFFAPLNEYPEDATDARAWLQTRWRDEHAAVGDFDALFDAGRFLFLLDALNEMPQRDREDYARKVGHWKRFIAAAARKGNRVVFTCRSVDYSSPLSSTDLPVPQVTVKPMTPPLINEFLQRYLGERGNAVYATLSADTRQLELYSTPYFLSLLVTLVDADGGVPIGRADLFTRFVRAALARELGRDAPALASPVLLDEVDRVQISNGDWGLYSLPESGVLIPKLTALAYAMQQRERNSEGSQVSLPRAEAIELLDHPAAADVLKAGESLNVLDRGAGEGGAPRIKFFHQLLQEYFAARPLVIKNDASLVRQTWRAAEVKPSLAETLAALADSDPLPPLESSGWEETVRIAAAMSSDQPAYVHALMAENLPLAGIVAASPDLALPEALKDELRQALVVRSQDLSADLRARIAAGLALGNLGDPRFERKTGIHAEYLKPRTVPFRAGRHIVIDRFWDAVQRGATFYELFGAGLKLNALEIGEFPVTNAEFKCFIDAGGYETIEWWDTDAARRWLSGEISDGDKKWWRDWWKFWHRISSDALMRWLYPKLYSTITSVDMDDRIRKKNMSREQLEIELEKAFPSDKKWREPRNWNDSEFNNPTQPVVGVCWHEARAYCNWLSAQTGLSYRLPTEVEWEATARGPKRRKYAYVGKFDSGRGNTFESHIRRTTPVGIYPNGRTPDGVYDITGNVWEWTSSVYEPDMLLTSKEHDDPQIEAPRRVLRGGSWNLNRYFARAASRCYFHPSLRDFDFGFRLVVGAAPVA